MYAPEGYVSFTQMVEFVEDWAYRIYLGHLVEEMGKEPEKVFSSQKSGSEMLITFRLHQLRTDHPDYTPNDADSGWREYLRVTREDSFFVPVLFHCIFSKVLMRLDTLLVSFDGKVIRPDDYIFLHLDRLDWVYPTWPIRETTELFQMIKYRDNGQFSADDIAERYCFLDFSLGTISLKNNSVSGFLHCSHFSDDAFSKRYIETHVKPFLTRAVVWNEDDLPENFLEFLESIGAILPHWELSTRVESLEAGTKPSKKRGAKPTGAREEFIKRYPDGKPDNLSAEAIAAELTDAGYPISGRQVLNYSKEIKSE